MRVISISGERGAGKDEAAKIIESHLKMKGVRCCRISFAEVLYQEISKAYGVTVDRLQDRGEKELPQSYLALENCNDHDFVRVATAYLEKLRGEPINMSSALSPREILKTWGNGYRRESAFGHENYFVDHVANLVESKPQWTFIISDTRQDNEFDALGINDEPSNTLFLRINRSDFPLDDHVALNGAHPTDVQWRFKEYAEVVVNPYGDLEGFRERLKEVCGRRFGEVESGATLKFA